MEDCTPPPSDTDSKLLCSAATLRELEQRAHAALTANRESVSQLEADITSRLERISATLREQALDESHAGREADNSQADIERLRADWATERSALEAERDELTLQRDELVQQVLRLEDEQQAADGNRQRQIAELEQKLSEQQAAWVAERSALEAQRDDLVRQATKLESEERTTKDEWQRQLAEFECKLGEQQGAWSEQRASWSKEREEIESQRDELRQKFELALEDVQRFRGRVAELEQELARRPETNEADSAELVALRAERAALAERVEALERQPAAQIDSSGEQQLADLQRRFELAVEDVRELKTKNAELEARLAAAGSRAGSGGDSGGMDWESQKRRLLESLEDSSEEQNTPDRQKERVTIQNTIEMTDAVVAEKDSQIAELKARLAAAGDATAAEVERDRRINELVDADEVIAQHRKRFAQLESEMEEKLRAHELELSLERAKIARQKTELEDLRAELEAQRNALSIGGGAAPAPGAPRRRWLSKLGLSGEEQ